MKACAVLLLAVIGARAQTTQGLILGRVVDSVFGQPLAAVEIRCDAGAGGPAQVAHTGTGGYFVLPLLSPGLYAIRVQTPGYQAQEVHDVELAVSGRLEFQIRLRPLNDVWEAGQYHGVFLPKSGAILPFYGPDVDTSYATSMELARIGAGALEGPVSQVIDPAEVKALPLAGRDIYTTLTLQPGVTAGTADARGLGLAVAGQRPTSSNFLLDGVENNNYLVSGPLVAVAPEAVQEYRIGTNSFSAEYGGTAGVLANAVTRGGGGAWHGTAYFYTRNEIFDANDFQRNLAGISRSPLREAQPGFQVGGPAWKNRLFTSTSLEYLRSRDYGDPVQAQLPTTGFLSYLQDAAQASAGAAYVLQLMRQHPFAAPQSASQFSEVVNLSIPTFVDRWLGLERIDYATPGGIHRVMARVSEGRVARPDFLWSPYAGFDAPLIENTFGAVAAVTSAFNPHLTNEGRLGWSSDDLRWDRPDPGVPTLEIGSGNTGGTLLPGSLAFYSFRNRSRTWEASDELVWSLGAHLVQFGGGVLLRGIDGYLTAGRDGKYSFQTLQQFAVGQPDAFSILVDRAELPGYQLPNYNRNYSYDQFHFFIQDSFRITQRLAVNYGVRYENAGAPVNTGPAKDELFLPGVGPTLDRRIASGALQLPGPGDRQIYSPDNRGWAPRLGGSYGLTGKGTLEIHGAYGIYYDRPFDNLWENVRLNGSAPLNFDIAANQTPFLSPPLPQLPSFQLQPVPGNLPNITWVDPHLRNAYVQNFVLGLQQKLGNFTLDVNGAGELGRKLITTDVLNRAGENPALPEIFYRANQGASEYGAFTALARYRSSSIQMQAAYTWSHSIDNQSSPLAGDFFDLGFVRLTSATAQEPPPGFSIEQNSRVDKGNSDFDQRQNLVLSAIVAIPNPHRHFPAPWLLRNWRVAALASARSGFPYTVFASGVRADLLNPSPEENVPGPGGRFLVNPNAFAVPMTAVGSLGRNALEGPGLVSLDISLNRSLPLPWLGEAGRLNLRADAFNSLNHANLGNPDEHLGDSTFGLATYGRLAQPTGFPGLLPLSETARQIQLMVRLEW